VTGVAAEVGSTANHYQILARLATGGMAEIFLARGISAPGVERYCVLKRILRNRASDVHFVKMFLDEARLAAQLQHANIAQVYDIGKLGDSYFFTMEYVHGETVRALLQRARSLRRELPLGCILTVLNGAAAGLHHAHTRIGIDGRPLNIVHRDVSPSNLMVGYEGGVKVVDFGVAKAADRMQETKSGTVKGKISYLSPEQCRGHAIDRRSDLFSLGICFWEMLTTERLYRRASDFENMTAIVNEAPPPPSSRRPGLAPAIDAIALRLLAKDPAARFQTAEELVEALEDIGTEAGAKISSSALGRVLRDMFGQRPEPWLELAEANETADGVTVTSEPIPKELGIPVEDQVDLSLASVPDLAKLASTGPREPAPASVPPPVISAPVTVPMSAAVAAALAPTEVVPLVSPDEMATVRSVKQPPPPEMGKTMLGPGVSMLARAPAAYSGTGSQASYPQMPAFPPVATQSGEASPSSTRWLLLGVVGAAAVIGSLTVWIVMRAASSSDVKERPKFEATAAVPPEPPAPAPEIDAATPAVAIDAPEPAPIAVAEKQAAPAPSPSPAPAPAAPPPSPDEPKPAVTKDSLQAAYMSGRYTDVASACQKGAVTDAPVLCAISACHLHQETRAKQWYGKVASAKQRARVAASCRDLGVELAARRPPPDKPSGDKPAPKEPNPCEANPMDCQR
jgi:eukaryotic-like serine/threonine-protein kinase